MYEIKVNNAWCKKCGFCIEFCPVELFDTDIDGLPLPKRQEKCIGCMLCEIRCPDFAIKVEKVEVEQDEK